MDHTEPPAASLSSNSIRLLRSTSRTFTGGAAHIPPQSEDTAADEATPIRQQSRRNAIRTQEELQGRIVEEVSQWFMARIHWFIAIGFIFLVLLLTMAVLWVLAAFAAINYQFSDHNKPCDQPLQWYLLVNILWGQVPQVLTDLTVRFFRIEDPFNKILVTLAASIPSWALIGWGVYMLCNAKTCPKDNPGLFYPTKHYIIVQVIVTVATTIFILIFALGFRRLLALVNVLMENPGCEKAVHKLPKVEAGDQELIDSTDGEFKACVICLQELSKEKAAKQVIVRTPCSHHFHEDCLADWCKNHLECPLCREVVGEPDPVDESAV